MSDLNWFASEFVGNEDVRGAEYDGSISRWAMRRFFFFRWSFHSLRIIPAVIILFSSEFYFEPFVVGDEVIIYR